MREMVSGGAEEKVSLYRPISPHIYPISTLYLPYIYPISPRTSPYLPCISPPSGAAGPVSPLYLPTLRSIWTRISPVSPHPQEQLDALLHEY